MNTNENNHREPLINIEDQEAGRVGNLNNINDQEANRMSMNPEVTVFICTLKLINDNEINMMISSLIFDQNLFPLFYE